MTPKTYKTVGAARKAIKDAGMAAMIVRYDDVTGRFGGAKNYQPVVLCDLPEDIHEVRRRGFVAEMKHTKIEEGATVRLKDSIPVKKKGELAVVIGFLTEKAGGGGVCLDRKLDGGKFWDEDSLELIAREEAKA
jgi:hypothetical protein